MSQKDYEQQQKQGYLNNTTLKDCKNAKIYILFPQNMEGLVLQWTRTVLYEVRTEFLYGRNFEERQSSKRPKYYNLNFSVPLYS